MPNREKRMWPPCPYSALMFFCILFLGECIGRYSICLAFGFVLILCYHILICSCVFPQMCVHVCGWVGVCQGWCVEAGTTCRSLFCLSTMWVPGDQTQVIWVGYKCVYPLSWQPWFWVLFLETGLHSVCQVGLESAVWPPLAPASASSVLRWQAWATTFALMFLFLEKAVWHT